MQRTGSIKAYLLVLVVAVPQVFFLFYILQQQYIKHQMREQLEQQNLQTIILPVTQVQWIEEGKEMWIDNKLFDVAAVQAENGFLILKGLFDEAETALAKQIENACHEESKSNRFVFFQFFQLLNNCFYQWPDERPVTNTQMLLTFSYTSESLSDGYNQIICPPPQCLL